MVKPIWKLKHLEDIKDLLAQGCNLCEGQVDIPMLYHDYPHHRNSQPGYIFYFSYPELLYQPNLDYPCVTSSLQNLELDLNPQFFQP